MARPVTQNLSWLTTATAATMDQYKPTVIDNTYDSNPVLKEIKDKSRVLFTASGEKIVVEIDIEGNTTTKSFKGYDNLEYNPSAGLVNPSIEHAYYATLMAMAYTEKIENMGKERVVDLISTKIQQAERGFQNKLSNDLFASSVGNGGKDITGFPLMIAAQETENAYMGITDDKWTNKYEACSTVTVANAFFTIWRKLRDGMAKPDMIITSDDGEALYEAQLLDKDGVDVGIRYANNDKGDIGYSALAFKGIPFVIDKHVVDYADGLPRFWWLNMEHLGFMLENDGVGEWQKATGQMATTNEMISRCQLLTDNRRRQGLIEVTSEA